MLCGMSLFLRCNSFGGAHCPGRWYVLSEEIADLVNDLLPCEDWDASKFSSPCSSTLVDPSTLGPTTPFVQALAADVVVSIDSWECIDSHINDLITIVLVGKNWRRLCGAALLAFCTFGSPVSNQESIHRDDLVSMDKLLGDCSLSKIK